MTFILGKRLSMAAFLLSTIDSIRVWMSVTPGQARIGRAQWCRLAGGNLSGCCSLTVWKSSSYLPANRRCIVQVGCPLCLGFWLWHSQWCHWAQSQEGMVLPDMVFRKICTSASVRLLHCLIDEKGCIQYLKTVSFPRSHSWHPYQHTPVIFLVDPLWIGTFFFSSAFQILSLFQSLCSLIDLPWHSVLFVFPSCSWSTMSSLEL